MSFSISGSRKSSFASMTSSMFSGPVPEGLIRCTICGRNFSEDRIHKHKQICQKTRTKRRRVFDTTKHRLQGTDAERFFNRRRSDATSTSRRSLSGSIVSGPAAAATPANKSSWRRKHEEFIRTIRAAKEMQAHLAKGGRMSDLPPPPPSENPDYVQCPHCMRRFNPTAADRHIPKCATMLHNKPGQSAGRSMRF